MTILTFPSILPSSCKWGLVSNTEKFKSPLTGSVQTVARPGARWKCTLDFEVLTLAQGADLEAFLAEMDGQAGRCYIPPFHRPMSVGNGLVFGPNQTGKALVATGYTALSTPFKRGDFFSVNDELKLCTANALADGSGHITLNFVPPLRAKPADASTVVGTNPTCIMMLSSDEYELPRPIGLYYENVSISFEEAFV